MTDSTTDNLNPPQAGTTGGVQTEGASAAGGSGMSSGQTRDITTGTDADAAEVAELSKDDDGLADEKDA